MTQDYEGFIGTPFHSRTAAATETPLWYSWGPYVVPDIYTDFEEELRAMREAATLNEMSPLSKIRISGPDAALMADRLITRNAVDQEVGQILYSPWCNDAGKVVADGLIFRFGETDYVFVAGPQERWFASNRGDLDVEIEDVSPSIGILALQGPKSTEVLNAATGRDWSDLKFSRLQRTEIGGVTVDLSRQGFTGEVGYELWVSADGAGAMWDALVEVGEPHGLRPAGEYAIDISRVEAGLLIIGADYMGAGPDPTADNIGDVTGMRPPSPFELRMDKLVDFDKKDFIGKKALVAEQAAGGPPLRMIGLTLDWKAMLAHQSERGALTEMFPRVGRVPLPVFQGSRKVGHATSVTWGPTVGAFIGLGHLEKELAVPGTELAVGWSVDGEEVLIGATVVDLPFRAYRRA
jgi:aminomethyltransferase